MYKMLTILALSFTISFSGDLHNVRRDSIGNSKFSQTHIYPVAIFHDMQDIYAIVETDYPEHSFRLIALTGDTNECFVPRGIYRIDSTEIKFVIPMNDINKLKHSNTYCNMLSVKNLQFTKQMSHESVQLITEFYVEQNGTVSAQVVSDVETHQLTDTIIVSNIDQIRFYDNLIEVYSFKNERLDITSYRTSKTRGEMVHNIFLQMLYLRE